MSTTEVIVLVTGTGPVLVIDALQQGLQGPIGPGVAVNSNGTSTVPLTFSNSNNVSLGVSNGVVTLSASFPSNQASGMPVTVGGNYAGAGGLISTGTLFLAGGNNVTLSQSGNSVFISGPNSFTQSVQPGIKSLVVGTATYTSGQISFANSNGVTFGGDSNGLITASVDVQSSQSNQTIGVYGNSNTVGSSAGTLDARSLSIRGAGAVSVGLSDGGIVISGPPLTGVVDGANLLVVNGDAASTATTLTLSNSNNVSFGQAGGVITASASFTQTVQTQSIVNRVQISGNTIGVNVPIESGVVNLVGGDNVTLSQDGNSIQFLAPAPTIQSVQPGIQSIAVGGSTFTNGQVALVNSNGISFGSAAGGISASYTVPTQSVQPGIQSIAFGDTTFTTGALSFSNANGFSFGSSNGQVTASYTVPTVPAQTVQTQNLHNVTLSGNTAGVMAAVSSGTLTLAGGNNITLSQNGNAITISGPTTSPQSVQPGIQSIAFADTTFTTGALSFSNANGFSFGSSAGQVTASYTVPSVPAQTNQTIGVYGSSQTVGQSSSSTIDARSLSFVGQGIVSVGLSSGSVLLSATVPSQTVQTQNLHNVTLSGNTAGVMAQVSSGTLTLAGGNNITLSQNGNAITISGPTTVAQTNQSVGIYGVLNTTGQSSSSTVDARSLSFAGAGVASVGMSGGSVVISVPAGGGGGDGFNIVSMLTSTSGGGTAGETFSTLSGSIGLMAGSNITLSQTSNTLVIVAPSQTVQTENLHNVTLSGNTAGVMAQVSSGTLTLAGGNNVTLSQNGNAITISGPTTVAQTNQTIGVYGSSQTVGQSSSSTVDARSLSFVGQGLVSVGMSGGSVLLSATSAAQTNQSLGLYHVGNTTGQSSSSTVDARTLSFSGAGLVSVGMSAGNIVVSATAPSQTVQTQNLHNVTLSGNTAGVMDQVSSGTLTLAGGNNITLSQNGNAVTISGPSTVAQTNQTLGIYGSSQTVGQSSSSTVDARSLSFVGQGIVSVGVSGGSVLVSATSVAQTVQTQNLHNVTLTGNTAGVMDQISSGTLTLAGGNNITLSQNGNAITISGPTTLAQSVQPGIQSIAFANTTFTTGALSFSNANGVSFGSSGGQVTVSYTVPNQTVQTIGVYGVSNTVGQSSSSSVDARSLSFAGAGIASVGMSDGSVLISVPSGGGGAGTNTLGMSNLGNTVGTSGVISGTNLQLVLAGGNNITLSQSINGSSATITLSGANTVAQTNQSVGLYAVSNTTQSSSGTVDARSLSFAGAGIASVGITGNSILISVPSGGGGGGGIGAGVSTAGNTAGSTGTVTTGNVVFVGSGPISLSQSTGAAGSNATITIMGPAVSSLVAGTNITLSTAGSTVSVIGAGADGYNIVSMLTSTSGGGTAGNTFSALSGSVGFMAGSGITLSQTSNTIVIGANTAPDVLYILGNTAGGVSSLSGDSFYFSGGNNITLSENAGTIRIQGPGPVTVDKLYWPPTVVNSQTQFPAQSTNYIYPISAGVAFNASILRMLQSVSIASTTFASTANTTFSFLQQESHFFVVYSRGTGASNNSLFSLTSTSFGRTYSLNVGYGSASNTSQGNTYGLTYQRFDGTSSFSTSISTSNNASIVVSTNNATALTGMKFIEFPFGMTLSEGEYWMAYRISSTTSTQATNLSGARLQANYIAQSQVNNTLGSFGAANNATIQLLKGIGSVTTAGGGTLSALNFSNISSSASHPIPYVTFVNVD